jgi:competence ComEA-like helix-hairpin-helix protein
MGDLKFLEGYFSFTRKERIGLICLVLVILLVYFLPVLVGPLTGGHNDYLADSVVIAAAESLRKDEIQNQGAGETVDMDDHFKAEPSAGTVTRVFPFDPNTLPEQGWQQLGISSKTAATIRNFLSKGGRFYKPEDLGRIYGLRKKDYDRLLPYVRIAEKSYTRSSMEVEPETRIKKTPLVININEADSLELVRLDGIGPKLASRIIAFREKLGGFYEVGQLKETYGLPDSTFQKIRSVVTISTASLKRININTATKDQLKMHPYIKWNLANAIVEYRVQHGPYQSLDQLKKIALVDEEVFRKASPYLMIE